MPYGALQFKRDVVAACSAPGVSMAAVALANGLNANLLRRWVNEQEAAPAAAAQDIKLELRSGAVLINITWPVAAASECAAWVAAVLR